MNNIDKIKLNLKKSTILTTILSVVFSFMLLLSIVVYFIFDKFKEYIKEEVSESFYNLLNNEGSPAILLVYILIFILIVPFLIESITQTIKSNKISDEINTINLQSYIDILKNTFIFMAFALAFIVGAIIAYFTLKIGNILFILIPLLLTVPFYAICIIFKIKVFKLAHIEYKKK